jgi:hypothetical protein
VQLQSTMPRRPEAPLRSSRRPPCTRNCRARRGPPSPSGPRTGPSCSRRELRREHQPHQRRPPPHPTARRTRSPSSLRTRRRRRSRDARQPSRPPRDPSSHLGPPPLRRGQQQRRRTDEAGGPAAARAMFPPRRSPRATQGPVNFVILGDTLVCGFHFGSGRTIQQLMSTQDSLSQLH